VETIECPHCGSKLSATLESRPIVLNGHTIRIRRRLCRHCKRQFKTKEFVDQKIQFPSSLSRQSPKSGLDVGTVF